MASNEKRVGTEFWPKLTRVLSRVPFAEDAIAAFYCAFDPATPARAKAVLLASLAYFVMPLDVIPDFILGLGFTDDMAVLYAAFTAIQSNLRLEHRTLAKQALARLQARDV